MIIKIGGVDAAGKATQSQLLTESLTRFGYKTELMSFPNYPSITGQAILGNLKKEWQIVPWTDSTESPIDCEKRSKFLNSLVLQSLMIVDRYQHIEKLRHYKHSSTEVLVLDRYYLSGIIYGTVDGLPLEWLEAVHAGMPEPDLSVYLSIPLEESINRRPERRDRYEKDLEFLGRVRDAYISYFTTRRMHNPTGYALVDGMQTVENVHKDVILAAANVLPKVALSIEHRYDQL